VGKSKERHGGREGEGGKESRRGMEGEGKDGVVRAGERGSKHNTNEQTAYLCSWIVLDGCDDACLSCTVSIGDECLPDVGLHCSLCVTR
jgi:hypothetical protein